MYSKELSKREGIYVGQSGVACWGWPTDTLLKKEASESTDYGSN